MLALPVLHFFVFYVYVNINSILMAFQLPTDGVKPIWSLENFKTIFVEFAQSNSLILSALKNTLIFFFSGLLITLPLSILMCYFLYKRIAGYKIYRVIFFLPNIISASVIAVLFRYLIAGNGPISVLYQLVGAKIPPFLSDSRYALSTILFYTIFFGLGGNLILFSGAMTNIETSILEAGKIDGVGMLGEIIYIVIPLIWPTLSTVLIFNFIGIFNASGPILLFTRGAYDTYTISYWIYDRVAFHNELNYPAAVGLFFTAIGAPIAILMRWLLTRNLDDVSM